MFRGISTSEPGQVDSILNQMRQHIKDGTDWVDKGIVSTTASESFAKGWLRSNVSGSGGGGGVLLRIKANSGMLISTFTMLPHQQEILQKPGSRYRPVKISQEKGPFGAVSVVDLEQV